MKIEWWRYISGFVGLYMVSTFGRVKSVERYVWVESRCCNKLCKEKILHQGQSKGGYSMVRLYDGAVGETRFVHRLVSEAFIPNPNNYPCVNHKNEIKTDNRVENLEWCTTSYNCNYGTRNKRLSKKLCGNKNALGKLDNNNLGKPTL